MDVNSILKNIQSGLALAQAFSPALAAVGLPQVAGAAKVVDGLLEIGQDLLGAIDDGRVIATSDDQEELKALIGRLRAENKALGDKIAAS